MQLLMLTILSSSVVLTVSAAAASASPRQAYRETFTSQRPGVPTGAVLKVDWLGAHPGAKPHTITSDVFSLARGAKYDFSVPAKCKATDAQLMAHGASACPRKSKVAYGEVDLDTGAALGPVPRIVKTSLTVFNGGAGKLISLATTTNLPLSISTVDRSKVRGTSITTKNPELPGSPPPDMFVAVKRDRIHFLNITRGTGKHRRGFITTPPTCPRNRWWINRATFSYHDKVTKHASSRSRCRP
jgi:hypothetical protein